MAQEMSSSQFLCHFQVATQGQDPKSQTTRRAIPYCLVTLLTTCTCFIFHFPSGNMEYY